MKKIQNEQRNIIKLPEGVCNSWCCGDCLYMDTNATNSVGYCWCGKKRKYYPASDVTCGQFKAR